MEVKILDQEESDKKRMLHPWLFRGIAIGLLLINCFIIVVIARIQSWPVSYALAYFTFFEALLWGLLVGFGQILERLVEGYGKGRRLSGGILSYSLFIVLNILFAMLGLGLLFFGGSSI